jgi:hypothetical protein
MNGGILMYRNVFMNKSNDELADIRELNERICEGENPIKQLIGVKEGVVSWYDSTKIETKEDNEENGELMEYIKLEGFKTLYNEFENDIDEMLEEIVNYKVTEDDRMLNVVTRSTCNNMIYIYNYYRDENENLIKNEIMINKSMLMGIFQ